MSRRLRDAGRSALIGGGVLLFILAAAASTQGPHPGAPYRGAPEYAVTGVE